MYKKTIHVILNAMKYLVHSVNYETLRYAQGDRRGEGWCGVCAGLPTNLRNLIQDDFAHSHDNRDRNKIIKKEMNREPKNREYLRR